MSRGKRFTDIGKWEQSWFRKLDPERKIAFLFLCDRVDQTGCWEVDIETFEHYTKCKTPFLEILESLKGFDWLSPSKGDGEILIMPRFIEFQYGELSEGCPAHKPIYKLLRMRGILDAYLEKTHPFVNRVYNSLPHRVSNTLQEKEKEKELEKGKEKRELVEEAVKYYNQEIYPKIRDGSKVRDITKKRETELHARLKEMPPSIDHLHHFKVVCQIVLQSPFLCGVETTWRCDFDWIIKKANWNKILEGKYPPPRKEIVTSDDHGKGW